MSELVTLIPLVKGPSELTKINPSWDRTRLSLGQDYRIYAQIDVLNRLKKEVTITVETEKIPPQLWLRVYGEEGPKEKRTNSYGDVLHFAYAENFKKLILPDNPSLETQAAIAYISTLPDNIPIIIDF